MKDVKRGYLYIFEICLIVLSILFIAYGLGTLANVGWDNHANCTALGAYENGLNPYILSDVNTVDHTGYLFPYTPLTLYLLKLSCGFNYLITHSLALFLGAYFVYLSDKKLQILLFFTLLLSGFKAAYWIYIPGNFIVLSFVLVSLMFYFVSRKKYLLATLPLGLAGAINFLPLVLSPAFLWLSEDKFRKIKYVAGVLLTFLLTSLVSYLLFSGITETYYQAISGQLDQHTPIQEQGSEGYNYALVFLFKEVVDNFFPGLGIAGVALFFLVAISFLFSVFIKHQKLIKHERERFSLSFLYLFFLLPRLKAYFFILAVIPIYFLIKDLNNKEKLVSVFIVSFAPLVSTFLKMFTENFILPYDQTLSLITLLVYLFLLQKRSAEKTKI